MTTHGKRFPADSFIDSNNGNQNIIDQASCAWCSAQNQASVCATQREVPMTKPPFQAALSCGSGGSGLRLQRRLFGRRHVLNRLVMMALHAVLVTQYLTVEFVDQHINRRVQVAVCAFDKDVLAL